MQLSTEPIVKYMLENGAIKPLVLILFLIIAVFIVIYNWIYLARTLHAHSQVGLESPTHIDYLVKASSFIALFTAALILFFLLFSR